MLFSRLFSLILRTGQWIFAAIVLGLTAYFMHRHRSHGEGPYGRLIFAIIWSCLSIIAAVIWAIPTTSSMTGYVSDLGKPTPPSSNGSPLNISY
jgi:heme/copper-type cytochrome/quinol oxidase subunit 2